MSVSETFHGFIETTQDSLLIFEACKRNILPKISRRLQEKERKLVRSGSVFVFDEKESGKSIYTILPRAALILIRAIGIKRWTDGLVWSPSRIMGNFLIYRELDKKPTTAEKQQQIRKLSLAERGSNTTSNKVRSVSSTYDQSRSRERHLVGSLSDSYNFKANGLIKKTTSIVVFGAPFHLISYYHPNDVLENQLRTPSAVPELANLEISLELLSKQNFRIPPMVEPDGQNFQTQQSYHHLIPLEVDLNNYNASCMLSPTPTYSTPHPSLPLSHFNRNASISTPLTVHNNHGFQPRKPSTFNLLLSSEDRQQQDQSANLYSPSSMSAANNYYG
jgi:hypothetical protein